MNADPRTWPLDPIDRQSEVMFGLLMTLTFTGTMSVALGSGATVRDILLAALGCNIAWGIVDATVYLLTTAAGRVRDREQSAAIRAAPDAQAYEMLRSLLPERAGELLTDAQAAAIVAWMRRNPAAQRAGPVLHGADFRAALQVFLLVSGSTFPPILPFLLIDSVPVAMRLSNAVAVAMLVLIGRNLDRQMHSGRHVMHWIIPVVGCAMVAVTIVLGG